MVIAFDLDDTLYFEHDFLESGLRPWHMNCNDKAFWSHMRLFASSTANRLLPNA